MTSNEHQLMEASFSTLVLSIASSAALNMGLTPNPQSGKTEKNMAIAKFNIDLLNVMKKKTKNNLEPSEFELLDKVISDLQLQFVSLNK